MSITLEQKNIQSFVNAFGASRFNTLDTEYILRRRADANPDADYQSWLNSPSKAIVMPDMIPRSDKVADIYTTSNLNVNFGQNISQYFQDLETDPHLFQNVVQLRQIVKDVGFDPNICITQDNQQIDLLIILDCGNGVLINHMLQRYKPRNVFVALDRWEDFVVSFTKVDWPALHEQLESSADTDFGLHIQRINDPLEIIGFLNTTNISLLEHAYTICMSDSSDAVQDSLRRVTSNEAHNVINYLGFVQDEYNMVRIAASNLCDSIKLFYPPLIHHKTNNIVICASGPSLDSSLADLKTLQETHLIAASASSFGTLKKNGIRVDILCIVERGYFLYDDYQPVVDVDSQKKTLLVGAIVTNGRLFDLFDNVICFQRSALTPFVLFSQSPMEALTFEGPQAVNATHSFVEKFMPESILLVGADLGTSDPSKQRSQGAVGFTPRNLGIEVRPNQPTRDVAYTDPNLLDTKSVIEKVVKCHSADTKRFNLSDGIYIEGFTPVSSLSQYLSLVTPSASKLESSIASVQRWYADARKNTAADFLAAWRKGGQRKSVYETITELRRVLLAQPDAEFTNQDYAAITKILSCSGPRRTQFCPRVIRGCILKTVVCVKRQAIIMRHEPDKCLAFHTKAKLMLLSSLDILEKELYLLCDYVESENTLKLNYRVQSLA